MAYAVLFGSNLYVGTTGVLTVTDKDPSTGQDKTTEFFRIREIDRKRSLGSYLVVDCDIKDPNGNREVKLFKSKPVAGSADVEVLNPGRAVEVRRADGSLVADGVSGSIHRVGASLQGAPACNGWTFWFFERDGALVPIDLLREKVRAEMAAT